jgi:phosphoserine phosphatase
MNVFDFDKTIYPVDSTVAFYRWCLRRYPACWVTLPWTIWGGLRLALGCDKTKSKAIIFRFLRHVPAEAAEQFWDERAGLLCDWYKDLKHEEELIISASPQFLLAPMEKRLGVTILASPVDEKGVYHGPNCHGPEKVRRYRALYGDKPVDRFWSDSLSDSPMAELAAQAYLVKNAKNGVIDPWPEAK